MPRRGNTAPSVDLTVSSMASSHPFSDGRTAAGAPRAPSSVTSHSTKHTRRHRSSRSHHGGASMPSQNEFPNFAHTGDVDITISCDSQERRYLLHRLILAQCSGWFETSTSERWSGRDVAGGGAGGGTGTGIGSLPSSPPQTAGPLQLRQIEEGRWAGGPGVGEMEGSSPTSPTSPTSPNHLQVATIGKPFWRYELDYGSDSDDVPMLVRRNNRHGLFGGGSSPQPRPPSAKSKPPASSNGFFRSISAMQSVVNAPGLIAAGQGQQSQEPMNDTIRDYDNLFRIFYNYAPNLDAVSITEAYIQCKTLLTLADMYDALEVVGPRVDHHLLQFQNRLWKQIAKYPPSYLKLGYLARSKTIFSEALTHIVGQWPAGQAQLRNVPRPVLDLIEDKADDLDELRARLEGQLFRLTVVNSRGERAAPTSPNALDWLAVSLFRHWLVENLPPPPSPIMVNSLGGTTANPNPTGAKSVSFNPQTTTNGRPNSSHAPMLANESALSAGAGSGGGGGNDAVVRSSLIPATGRAFRLLGLAGNAYLPHDELKKHLKLHIDSQLYDKTMVKRFEKRIDDLKAQAQAVVKPLTRNALQADIGSRDGGGFRYLTCVGVGEGEWPW